MREERTIEIVSCDLCGTERKNGIPDVAMTEIQVSDQNRNSRSEQWLTRHVCEHCKDALLEKWNAWCR